MSQVQVGGGGPDANDLPDSEKRSGLLGCLLLLPAAIW